MMNPERRRREMLLESARRRLDAAVPHSPEWEAAIEALVELDQTNHRQRRPVLVEGKS